MSRGRRAATLLGALAVFSAAAWFARGVRFDSDVAHLLPDRGPLSRIASSPLVQRALQHLAIEASAEDGTEVATAALVRAVSRVRAAVAPPDAVGAAPAADGEATAAALERVRAAAPRLFRAEDAAELERELEAAPIRERVAVLLRRLLEPDGALRGAGAAADPLGVFDRPLRELARGLDALPGVSSRPDGILLGAGGRRALALAEPGFPATDLGASEALAARLAAAIEGVAADPECRGVRVRTMGAHRATLDNARQIRGDVHRTAALGAAFSAALAFVAFGSLWPALLGLLPAVFGGAVALAAFALLRRPLDAAIAGFGGALVGLTVDYSVHVLFQLRAGGRAPWRALLMSAATTAAAFLALLASDLPGVRALGVFGAVSVTAAAAFAAAVLPALARAPRARPLFDLAALVARVRSPARSRALLAAVAVLLVAAVPFARTVRFDGDPAHLSSLAPDTRADDEAIRGAWEPLFRRTIAVVHGRTLDEAAAANERVAALLEGEIAAGRLAAHAGLARLLPSLATQEQNLARWRAFFDAARIERLRADLAAATVGTPFRRGAFEPFLERLAVAPPPLAEADLAMLRPLVQDRVLAVADGVTFATPLEVGDLDAAAVLRARMEREVPGAQVLNAALAVRELALAVGGEIATLGWLSFAAVVLLVALATRSLRLAAAAAVPVLAGLLLAFGALGAAGVPVTLLSAVFVPFLFGVAIDYTVFMAETRVELRRTGVDRTATGDAAVLLCALTTCGCFAALSVSGHPVLVNIGATAAIGIAAAALAVFALGPPLLRWLR